MTAKSHPISKFKNNLLSADGKVLFIVRLIANWTDRHSSATFISHYVLKNDAFFRRVITLGNVHIYS